MAWIEAHQAVGNHGKTMLLAQRLGISRAQAVGHLVLLWWWALDSCGRDGLLARYSAEAVALGAGWDVDASGQMTAEPAGDCLDFFAALVDAGWIDFSGDYPSERFKPISGGAKIHDWPQYSGRYFDLDTKRQIEREQTRIRMQNMRARAVTIGGDGPVTPCDEHTRPTRPDQPDQTKETNLGQLAADFERFWAAYPRKTAKTVAFRSWCKLCPGPELAEKILKAIMAHRSSGQWAKDQGQFIPHPATWLNQQRWEDEIKPETRGGRIVGAAAVAPGKYDHLG